MRLIINNMALRFMITSHFGTLSRTNRPLTTCKLKCVLRTLHLLDITDFAYLHNSYPQWLKIPEVNQLYNVLKIEFKLTG